MKQAIRELFSHYKGKITESDNSLLIMAENTLLRTFNDDDGHFIVDKPTKVECFVEARVENECIFVNAWESSYCIKGGVGHRVDNEKAVADLEHWLDFFGFTRKQVEQLCLF